MTELSDHRRMVDTPNRNRLDRMIRNQAATIAKLSAALKPFADAVYNDNGDMTVTPCNREAYIAAYFARRSARQPEGGGA